MEIGISQDLVLALRGWLLFQLVLGDWSFGTVLATIVGGTLNCYYIARELARYWC